MKWTRRSLLKATLALPAGSYLTKYEALAAPQKLKVKIKDVKAMSVRFGTLVKIETDAGLTGYGEAGTSGPVARSRIAQIRSLLINQDPLEIERLFLNMTSTVHSYGGSPHIPTVSGIDMALWDLAGKIIGLPVCKLLGGPFRNQVRVYTDSEAFQPDARTYLDRGYCRDLAQRFKAHPYGWKIFKVRLPGIYLEKCPNCEGADPGPMLPSHRYSMLTSGEISKIGQSYANLREAFGDDIDIAVHCCNEPDLATAIEIARVTEPMRPIWFEDALPPLYSESWPALKRQSRIKILTGEKLEMPKQFLPFIQNEAVDILQPDLAWAGGFTGTKKIADLAWMYQIPMNLHSYASLVLMMASIQFGASVFDFFASESMLGREAAPGRPRIEDMAANKLPQVKNGYIDVPDGPGLGLELNQEVLKASLSPGEPWWG